MCDEIRIARFTSEEMANRYARECWTRGDVFTTYVTTCVRGWEVRITTQEFARRLGIGRA